MASCLFPLLAPDKLVHLEEEGKERKKARKHRAPSVRVPRRQRTHSHSRSLFFAELSFFAAVAQRCRSCRSNDEERWHRPAAGGADARALRVIAARCAQSVQGGSRGRQCWRGRGDDGGCPRHLGRAAAARGARGGEPRGGRAARGVRRAGARRRRRHHACRAVRRAGGGGVAAAAGERALDIRDQRGLRRGGGAVRCGARGGDAAGGHGSAAAGVGAPGQLRAAWCPQ